MFRLTTILCALCAQAAAAQNAEEVAFVRGLLAELQLISIAENVEYCGVIGFDTQGALVTSPPARGDEGSCLVEDDGPVVVAIASYHTHAAFSPDYSSEVPSVADVEGDEAEGIDGYVATPGGRMWFIDTSEEDILISQLCGIGCLPSDPEFIPGADGKIALTYSYDDLVTVLED